MNAGNGFGKDFGKLNKYLGLTDEQNFYNLYRKTIEAREFTFKRRRYMYDNEAHEVKYVRHEDTDRFMRVGPDWVKIINKVDSFDEVKQERCCSNS